MPKVTDLPYPNNLIFALFYGTLREDAVIDEQGLELAIQTLEPTEQKCIDLRFKQYKTLKIVGENFSHQPEWARQKIAKAMRKLKHPTRTRMYWRK